MAFEFLEIGSSACGCLATALGEAKFVVGPPICENFSPHLKLTDLRVLEWLIWLLWEGRLHAFAVRLCPWSPPETRSTAASAEPCRFGTVLPRAELQADFPGRNFRQISPGYRWRRGSQAGEPPLHPRQAPPHSYPRDEAERKEISYAALLVRVAIKCGRTAVVVTPFDSGVLEHSSWKKVIELGARLDVVSQGVFTAAAAVPCGGACGWSEPVSAKSPPWAQGCVANVLVVSSPPAGQRTGTSGSHALSPRYLLNSSCSCHNSNSARGSRPLNKFNLRSGFIKTRSCLDPQIVSAASTVHSPDCETTLLGTCALFFGTTLRLVRAELAPAQPDQRGCERSPVNELLVAGTWTEQRQWKWRRLGHINVLELESLASLLREDALAGDALRQAVILDSRVAMGATAKGRSPSKAVKAILERITATCIAAGSYPAVLFGPTRHNVADDPTRERRLREAIRRLSEWAEDPHLLRWLLELPPLNGGSVGVELPLPRDDSVRNSQGALPETEGRSPQPADFAVAGTC